MKNLFQASRVLLFDMASTLLFLAVYLLTGNILLAVALGMVLGIGQIAWELLRRRPVEALQWLSLLIILVSGTATFFTNDPVFVMLKPTVIYVVVGIVMLKRGWMTRYLPPIAQATVPDLGITFGYIWAGLMFFSAALNILLALTLEPAAWAAVKSVWAIGSKVTLFGIQYAVMRSTGVRRAKAMMAAT
jgi:intracellular septation protein